MASKSDTGVLSFGMAIRRARAMKRLSQREFAALAGLSPTTIWKLETDPTYVPRLQTIYAVCAQADLNPDAYLDALGATA